MLKENMRREAEWLKRIDDDNAARERRVALQHRVRAANRAGIEAFKHKDWDGAIARFERALALEPYNQMIATNLAETRRAKAAEWAELTAPVEVPARTVQLSTIAVAPGAVVSFVQAPSDWAPMTPAYELTASVLAERRKQFREMQPELFDFLKDASLHVAGHFARVSNVVEFTDQIKDAQEMHEKYKQTVEQLVDEASGAAHEAVSILGGGDGSTEHVLDAPKRMEQILGQFVDERLQSAMWGVVKAWGGQTIIDSLERAP